MKKEDALAAAQTKRQSEERIQAILDSIEDGYYEVDLAGNLTFFNDALCSIIGYPRSELMGMNNRQYMDKENAKRVFQTFNQVYATGEPSKGFDWELIGKEGTRRYIEASVSLIRDRESRPSGFRGIARDITARKQVEEVLRQRTAELEARNEELDAYAHTVAHDLKNPLGVIIGLAETLESDPASISIEDLARYLQMIAQHGRKISNIIDELLLLAGVRQIDVEPVPLDMARLVAEVRERLADMIEEYKAEILLPDTWPVALGYGPWIEEVWVNYLSNAIKYGGRPPRVELGASILDLGPGQDQAEVLDRESKLVRFWVHDNGPGLSVEEQARLFAPFTQLARDRAGGYGLGLSIVRRIVDKLGGEVGVESKGVPGQGSIFAFTLPADADQLA